MAEQTIPASLWPFPGAAPKLEHVLGQVAGLLNDLGYSKTSSALEREAVKKAGLAKLDPTDGLLALYNSSEAATTSPDDSDADSESSDSEDEGDDEADDESEQDEVEGALVDVEAEETSDDSSDEASSISSSSAMPVKTSTKRKRVATPSATGGSSSSSSSDDEDSGSSSSDDDTRPAKRSKVAMATTGASDSDSSSSDSSGDSSSSDSDSADSAAEESSDDSSSSSSSDDSSSESESDSAPAPPPVTFKKGKKDKKDKPATALATPKVDPKDTSSQSSATLQGDSPAAEAEDDMSGIHPDRLKQSQFAPTTRKEGAASAKKAAVPFSRIPADQKVDPRFSNEYVSYDYADKAYQDLVVTKGKGFTKEKNKKKRGSYRGGAIDLAPKGIKFDD